MTFDEFLEIPPCAVGKHSTVDDTPVPEPTPKAAASNHAEVPIPPPAARPPQAVPARNNTPAAVAQPESDSDEASAQVLPNTTCRRRGCNVTSPATPNPSRDDEQCVYHPGQAVFHEGNKGWSCCKKRVLEFDEFLQIPGCKTRTRHCFVGKKQANGTGLEKLSTVRHDFYQTSTTVHASLYLKKINKEISKVEFQESGEAVTLDLKTTDGKHYETVLPLYARIDVSKSTFKILGTKLELTLAKADGSGWPVLRSDERLTGEIIQTGRAGMA